MSQKSKRGGDFMSPAAAPAPSDESPGGEWWGRELFLVGRGPYSPCPEIIDVTGLARVLVFGPYRELPAGIWRATVTLDVSPDAARRPLDVQFGKLPDYTTSPLPFGVPGRHTVKLEYVLRKSGLAEVRVNLKRAAFHGEIRLFGAKVERAGDC